MRILSILMILAVTACGTIDNPPEASSAPEVINGHLEVDGHPTDLEILRASDNGVEKVFDLIGWDGEGYVMARIRLNHDIPFGPGSIYSSLHDEASGLRCEGTELGTWTQDETAWRLHATVADSPVVGYDRVSFVLETLPYESMEGSLDVREPF